MSSIARIILPISLDVLLISSIAESISSIFLLLSFTSTLVSCESLLAPSALTALALICSAISDIVTESSSVELACSVAPCANVCDAADTCSEPVPMPSATALISSSILPISLKSFSTTSIIFLYIPLWLSISTETVRSLSSIAFASISVS